MYDDEDLVLNDDFAREAENATDSDNPEPRCPCVFLLDTSGSMNTEDSYGISAISKLNTGLQTLKKAIMDDSKARKRVELALVNKNDQEIICKNRIGGGGAGDVYTTNDDNYVVKIYKSPLPEIASKLQFMISNVPDQPRSDNNHISLTWPLDILKDNRGNSGSVCGYLMKKAEGVILCEAWDRENWKGNATFSGHTWERALIIAYNVSVMVQNIHAKGYVIGDIKPDNILVRNDTSQITIIDTDSFQLKDSHEITHPCRWRTDEYEAPDINNEIRDKGLREPHQDCFTLAFMINCLLLHGWRPFAGYTGNDDVSEQKAMESGFSLYSGHCKPNKRFPSIECLPQSLSELFYRTFVTGHKNPRMRPSAREWTDAIESILETNRQGLSNCDVNGKHIFAAHLSACPWCALAKQRGRDDYEYQPPVIDGVSPQEIPPPRQKITPPVKNNPYINIPSPVGVNSQPKPLRQPKISPPAVSNFGLTIILTWTLINLIIACFFMYLNNSWHTAHM